ncbi:MAG: hypothetical protein AVDCRST_MAG50-1497, partial [uncultured Acidimicrobiales bacterium]
CPRRSTGWSCAPSGPATRMPTSQRCARVATTSRVAATSGPDPPLESRSRDTSRTRRTRTPASVCGGVGCSSAESTSCPSPRPGTRSATGWPSTQSVTAGPPPRAGRLSTTPVRCSRRPTSSPASTTETRGASPSCAGSASSTSSTSPPTSASICASTAAHRMRTRRRSPSARRRHRTSPSCAATSSRPPAGTRPARPARPRTPSPTTTTRATSRAGDATATSGWWPKTRRPVPSGRHGAGSCPRRDPGTDSWPTTSQSSASPSWRSEGARASAPACWPPSSSRRSAAASERSASASSCPTQRCASTSDPATQWWRLPPGRRRCCGLCRP